MQKILSMIMLFALCLVLHACGTPAPNDVSKQDIPSATTVDNDIIEFDNVIVADNMDVKIELVSFYTKDFTYSSGTQNEKIITLRFTNKTDHEIMLNPGNCYLDDEKMYVCGLDGSVSLEAGRAGEYSFQVAENTHPEHTALKSLDQLYNLEGSFSGLHVYEDSLKNTSLEIPFSISKAINGEVSTMATPDLDKYGDIVHALGTGTWYFNGGADTILNSIVFSNSAATISQVYFDGNGKHDNGTNDFAYSLDDTAITVTLSDGSNLMIPYNYADGTVVLETKTYFTPEDIINGLQGFWTQDSRLMGHHIYYVRFDGNTISSEHASAALGSSSGGYYWYGGDGYTASYQLNFGGFDSKMSHASDWFFNIIDGKVTLLHYDSICTPSSITKFPGQYGYSF